MIASSSRIARRADRILGAALRLCLRGYRLGISPLLGPHCRFEPSCSRYASEAIARHGAVTGLVLGARRLARCHPFHPGGFDPVPGTTRATFARLGRRPH
ncbi:membrane protein insertion efficiency factor YidD [bacterium]|nr:membrane protein insertion efficiency factor YidD [bacterium]